MAKKKKSPTVRIPAPPKAETVPETPPDAVASEPAPPMAKKKKSPTARIPAPPKAETGPGTPPDAVASEPAPPMAKKKRSPTARIPAPPKAETVPETPPDAVESEPAPPLSGKGKSVVIVESPAKAKTINKILGSKFIVKACMGHVRDLPERRLGIDVDNNFEPKYSIIKKKEKTLKELRAVTRSAEAVFLAPDPDREGEAIAWHLVQALKIPAKKVRRVTFNEITERGVLDAFKRPGEISMDRVYAQQARRLLDRIVGYKLSPLLWKKVGRGLSAGRVQSVAVRLIVEREREIQAFKPEEYWTIMAFLTQKNARLDAPQGFHADLDQVDGKDVRLGSQAAAQEVVDEARRSPFTVRSVTKKEKFEHPPQPFTTSTLQQQASNRLHYSASRTMMIAQQLYEGIDLGEKGSTGLITYMRTDSFRIADEAVAQCRAHITSTFGANYLPEKPPTPRKAGKSAQEAHEAIRPTDVTNDPEQIRPFLGEDQYKLYRLIWRRFVSSQMKSAEYLNTEAILEAGRTTFSARGRELKFDGFTALIGHRLKPDEQILPTLDAGEKLDSKDIVPTQHFTEPPPRFTEASLVKALEKFGIGRPSTYAPIISTVQDRGYVRSENRQLRPEELGMLVNDKLVEHFDNIMNTGFTAEMEKSLDRIEDGEVEWVKVLKAFYDAFLVDLDKAKDTMESVKGQEPAIPVPCEKCTKPMLIKWNKYGKFLACSAYPECKNTRPLQSPEAAGENCDTCESPMVIKSGRFGRFLACSKYPECKSTRPVPKGNKRLQIPKPWAQTCEKCQSKMAVKYGRRGAFIACTGYPNCKNTQPVPKDWYVDIKTGEPGAPAETCEPPKDWEEACDKCESPMAIRRGPRGFFIACTGYPKCRNIKPVPSGWIKSTAPAPPVEGADLPDADE